MSTLTYDAHSDRPQEECGVFAVRGYQDASKLCALGLHALQHRGQEACGIASFNENRFYTERHQGLVGEHFTDEARLEQLAGDMAIGHVRYSTSGGQHLRNVQPLYADVRSGSGQMNAHVGIALAHNGNLTNARAWRNQLVDEGAIFHSTSDSEVLLKLFARSTQASAVDRLIDTLRDVEGAFALVVMVNDEMFAARDPMGIRPLVLGEIDGAPVVASETCALNMIGARFVREVEPGEIISFTDEGERSYRFAPATLARPCAFEFLYFARPDSVIDGISVYEARKRMGMRLAQETPADIDVVVPVPDSGMASALGYAEAIGKPFDLGIIRAHFAGRTFIQPTQAKRDLGVRRKHAPNDAVLRGKRVLLVDDSVVRGTTSKKIVQMVRDAGAKEVHFRSASPPIKFPDFYGIDMAMRDELIAASHDLSRMEEMIGADSLGFLSVEGLYWAVLGESRDPVRPQLADHYFTGEYPTRLVDRDQDASDKNKQLSLLDDA